MEGLLNACVNTLHEQGMTRMFIDGVAGEVDHLKRLGMYSICTNNNQHKLTANVGFEEWAQYRDIWKDV